MPAIDWTNPSIHLLLAAIGALLVLLGLLFYFLPAARLKTLAIVVGIGGGMAAGTALGLHLIPAPSAADHGKADQGPPAPAPTTQEMLDRFRKATPTERMTLLARLPDNAATWHKVERGDVVPTIVERGVLESADNAEVVCKVHARRSDTTIASTIKWVIDDGTQVKKGDLLAELDDSELRERLRTQKSAVEQKKAELMHIQKQTELDVEQARLTLEEAGHQLTLAERDLKAYMGSDAERKKGLELQVKQARYLVKSRDFQVTTTKARADTSKQVAQSIVDAETTRMKELEIEIAHCKICAPRAGFVVFHVEKRRYSPSDPLLAQGEPVREGQNLLYIPDLSKMQVSTRIPEAVVSRLRRDQKANVRVDAFPDRPLTGQVNRIARVPETPSDRKVYPVTIALAANTPGLKPGMSAEIRVQMEPRLKVLRVPVQALLGKGRDAVCYVKSGAEIQERPVIAGLSDNGFIEIQNGLKEGDEVLRDPRALAKQLGEGVVFDEPHRAGTAEVP